MSIIDIWMDDPANLSKYRNSTKAYHPFSDTLIESKRGIFQ